MGYGYSLDIRERVAAFVDAGHSRRASARHYGVSESCAIKLMRRKAEHGSLRPGQQGRRPGTGKLGRYETFLIAVVEAKPDITMPELAERLVAEHGVEADPSSLSRALCRHGFTYKKSPDGLGMRTR